MPTEFPVKQLDRRTFKAALAKGQGRAMLHIMQYGLDGVKDFVLEACLHNQVYDQQLESGRGEWLFEMFRDSPYFSEFREAILTALETEDDFWNQFQLCRLVREVASRGDEIAHQKLREFVYRNAADPASEGDWLGVEDLLFFEDSEDFVGLARIFGQRLISDPDDFVYDNLLDQQAFPEYVRMLKQYSLEDEAISTYRKYLEYRNDERSSIKPLGKEAGKRLSNERTRKELSLSKTLDDARKKVGKHPGNYSRFGRVANPEELEQVYALLINEPDIEIRLRLLYVFYRAKLPRIDDLLLSWAVADNAQLRSATLAALSNCSDPRIHHLARTIVEAGAFLGTDYGIFDLFIHNYESGDGLLIQKSLDRIRPNSEGAHNLGYSLLEIANQQKDPALVNLLLWVYENTPCAHCRYRSIDWLDQFHQLPDTLRYECLYDSDEDIRALVNGKSKTKGIVEV